mgnify:CR=1 FL=1
MDQEIQVPYWIKCLRANPEAKQSFLVWIEEQKHDYEVFAIRKAQTLEQVHAARSTYEELDVMARMITWQDTEDAEYAHFLQTFGAGSAS